MRIAQSLFARTTSLMMVSGILLGASFEAHSKVYRYTLDDGTVVYGDRAPAAEDDEGHHVLSNRGVVVRKVLGRQARQEQAKRDQEAALAKQRDRALLATFTNEEELIRTRDDRIGMIDGLIGRLDDRIRILSERQALVASRIEDQEKLHGEGNAPSSLYEEQEGNQRNIDNAWALIDTRTEERNEVSAKFDVDLERYRNLKSNPNRTQ